MPLYLVKHDYLRFPILFLSEYGISLLKLAS